MRMAKASTFNLGTVQTAAKWKLLRSLAGHRFCQTGTMSVTRAEMDQLIIACGGEVHAVIKTQTDYLIVPSDDSYRKGSKYKAAENAGTKIITEAEFCEMILPTEEELRTT